MTYPPPNQQPGWQPSQPAGYPQPGYLPPQQTHVVSSTGLPTWMHMCYLFLGWIPCFLGWIIWPIHWWFAKSKSKATITTQATGYITPPSQYPGHGQPPAPPQI